MSYSNKSDNIYFNASVFNPNDALLEARYNENRDISYIVNGGNYKLSVIRFSIPTSAIKILEFRDNFYSVTLQYNNVNFRDFLELTNLDTSTVPPKPQTILRNNVNAQQGITDHSIYYFQQLLDSLNYSFQRAFNALKVAFPAAPPTNAPYMQFDQITQLFRLIVDTSYAPLVSAPSATIKVFMNSNLYYLFSTFEAQTFGSGLTDGLDDQLIISVTNNNYYPLPNTPSMQLGLAQMGSSVAKWFDIIKIIIKSSLPINQENIATAGANGSVLYDSIVTDFEPSIFTLADFTTDLVFNATIYRLVDIASNNELKVLTFNVFTEDKYGVVSPLMLQKFESMRMKWLFMRPTISNLMVANHP